MVRQRDGYAVLIDFSDAVVVEEEEGGGGGGGGGSGIGGVGGGSCGSSGSGGSGGGETESFRCARAEDLEDLWRALYEMLTSQAGFSFM